MNSKINRDLTECISCGCLFARRKNHCSYLADLPTLAPITPLRILQLACKAEKIAQLKHSTENLQFTNTGCCKTQNTNPATCCHFQEWFPARWCKVMNPVLIDMGPGGQGLPLEMNACKNLHYWLIGNIKTLYEMLQSKQNLTLSEITQRFCFP